MRVAVAGGRDRGGGDNWLRGKGLRGWPWNLGKGRLCGAGGGSSSGSMGFDGAPVGDLAPILFPRWQEELRRADISGETRVRFEREVLAFLAHCRRERAPASIALARLYVESI